MAYHIKIIKGNLLDAPKADFIVNPSNTILALGSGVSGAFSAACGPALQAAMSTKLQTVGKLSKGDVVLTGAGACRQFRHVLHAAVMDYNPGASEAAPGLADVRTILSNIEPFLADEAASQGGNVTLALPLMGTGVGGLGKRDVLMIYRDFFTRSIDFECDVTLYAHSESDRELMQSLFGC
jgi:O-acetyl-ADP-ribose deacetylase (regulator of RNase III)